MTFDVNDPRAVRSRAKKVGIWGYVLAFLIATATILIGARGMGDLFIAMVLPLGLLVLASVVAATLSLKLSSTYPQVENLRGPIRTTGWFSLAVGAVGAIACVALGIYGAAVIVALAGFMTFQVANANKYVLSR